MEGKRWKVWLMVFQPGREDIIRGLEAGGCEVTLGRSFTESNYFTEEELIAKIPEMDGIMVTTGELITRRVMEAAKKLKVISKQGRGVERSQKRISYLFKAQTSNVPACCVGVLVPQHGLDMADRVSFPVKN